MMDGFEDFLKNLEETGGEVSRPFYLEWMGANNIGDDGEWSEEGFKPRPDGLPRDVLLLWAAEYAISDIKNGGFHQFFTNGTGILAPELHEFLDRSGLSGAAEIVAEALSQFGNPYMRSQKDRELRLRFLSTDYSDPFESVNALFNAMLECDGMSYDDRCNQWLRDHCGITKLTDKLEI